MIRLARPPIRAASFGRRPSVRPVEAILVGAACLVAATLAAAVLERWLGVADASPVYLLAVVVVAGRFGTPAGLATSVASLLAYDFLFIPPTLTLTVAEPQEWLSLLLFLFVAVVIGRLTALQSERADEARRRAREAEALFAITQTIATADPVQAGVDDVVERLRAEIEAEGVWIGIGPSPALERFSGDAGGDRPDAAFHWMLRERPGGRPAEWVRIHAGRRGRSPTRPGEDAERADVGPPSEVFRVPIQVDGQPLGSIWFARASAPGMPGESTRRLLALAADQLGLALHRQRLAREATEAEIARRSDALKSALLDSVSHDLRTPLSSIRVAAGNLLDPEVEWSAAERRALARSIDVEAERLSLVVRNLLDLSRIQAGALVPALEVFALRELVESVVDRVVERADGRAVGIEIDDDLPPVLVDDVFLDEVLTNLLENAVRYAPAPAPIRVAASVVAAGSVDLVVEDGGPGVPPDALESVFDRFYRVSRPREGARRGMGIGLAVVRGLVEAMGGRAIARPSALGGLAVVLTLRMAPPEHASTVSLEASAP